MTSGFQSTNVMWMRVYEMYCICVRATLSWVLRMNAVCFVCLVCFVFEIIYVRSVISSWDWTCCPLEFWSRILTLMTLLFESATFYSMNWLGSLPKMTAMTNDTKFLSFFDKFINKQYDNLDWCFRFHWVKENTQIKFHEHLPHWNMMMIWWTAMLWPLWCFLFMSGLLSGFRGNKLLEWDKECNLW